MCASRSMGIIVGTIPSQWQTDLRRIDAGCCGCWRRRIAQPGSSLRRALISACRRAISSGRRRQRQRKLEDSTTPPPDRCGWIIARANPEARAKVRSFSENCAKSLTDYEAATGIMQAPQSTSVGRLPYLCGFCRS